MTADDNSQPSYKRRHLTPVGWGIIVMSVSLALVIGLWLWFGHVGPSYSANQLIGQQQNLRPQFGLPPKSVISDPKILLTPPSLRPPEYKGCIPYSYC
jgi:hypothetical protein